MSLFMSGVVACVGGLWACGGLRAHRGAANFHDHSGACGACGACGPVAPVWAWWGLWRLLACGGLGGPVGACGGLWGLWGPVGPLGPRSGMGVSWDRRSGSAWGWVRGGSLPTRGREEKNNMNMKKKKTNKKVNQEEAERAT